MGESAANPIGHINFSKKLIGKRSAGKPHAAFDVAGVGNMSNDTQIMRQFSTLLMRGSRKQDGNQPLRLLSTLQLKKINISNILYILFIIINFITCTEETNDNNKIRYPASYEKDTNIQWKIRTNIKRTIIEPINLEEYTNVNNINIGMKLPEKILKIPNNLGVRIGATAHTKAYKLIHKKINYTVGIDKYGIIIYIETADRNFRTPEGVSIKSKLKDVLIVARPQKVFSEKIWRHVICLPSGWNVAFETKITFIENMPQLEKPDVDMKVSSFFKTVN